MIVSRSVIFCVIMSFLNFSSFRATVVHSPMTTTQFPTFQKDRVERFYVRRRGRTTCSATPVPSRNVVLRGAAIRKADRNAISPNGFNKAPRRYSQSPFASPETLFFLFSFLIGENSNNVASELSSMITLTHVGEKLTKLHPTVRHDL